MTAAVAAAAKAADTDDRIKRKRIRISVNEIGTDKRKIPINSIESRSKIIYQHEWINA